MNSNSRYLLVFLGSNSRISLDEAVGFSAKNTKIEKIPQRDSKEEQANRLTMVIIFFDVVVVDFT